MAFLVGLVKNSYDATESFPPLTASGRVDLNLLNAILNVGRSQFHLHGLGLCIVATPRIGLIFYFFRPLAGSGPVGQS